MFVKIIGFAALLNILIIFYMTPLGILIRNLVPSAFDSLLRDFSHYSLLVSNIIFALILIYKELPEEYSKK